MLVAVQGDPEACQHPRRVLYDNGYWGCEACGGSGKCSPALTLAVRGYVYWRDATSYPREVEG